MRVLVTNDDGVYAEGLWALVKELKKVSEVVVAAPDREQSGVGTAVSLHQPLRATQVTPVIPGTETYSIEGTPADSVIVALGGLIQGRIDLVVSGINNGSNLGSDVLISGTVGAALQGCLRGLPSVALSVAALHEVHYDAAAELAALLAAKGATHPLPRGILLNINLPNLPLKEIKGIEITRPAQGNYVDRVEDGHDGRREYYWIVRDTPAFKTEEGTDIWALEEGKVSVAPLQSDLICSSKSPLLEELRSGLLDALFSSGT